MSKSLGNFFTLREVLAQHSPEALRYLLLSAHYRSPLDYSADSLRGAREALTRGYLALAAVSAPAGAHPVAPDAAVVAAFTAVMDDDFNTPGALGVLFDAVRQLNSSQDPARRAQLAQTVRTLGGVLGLFGDDAAAFLRGSAGTGLADDEIDALVAQRDAARVVRDFKHADALRAQLEQAGVVLEDAASGSRWRRG